MGGVEGWVEGFFVFQFGNITANSPNLAGQ